jgi:hypothetical protein
MIHQNPKDDQQHKLLRYAIARRWRRERRTWTTAELEAAVAGIVRQQQRDATEPRRDAKQLDLLDHGRYSNETRAIAAASSMKRQRSRRDAIELHIAAKGVYGSTREEVARFLQVGVNYVTGPILALIRSGRLVETSRKRATISGHPAAVIVSRLVGEDANG